ncbi:MAG TPA: lysylphosphatidylglycerol synthase domain-containing protein [Burkholderiales bacterium]|nr:lysylphosphatidylglycerol synthase domain-containing protein [Burkholderiales bacterium]
MNLFKKAWLLLFIVASLFFVYDYLQRQVGGLQQSFKFYPVFFFLAALVYLLFWLNVIWCWRQIVSIIANVKLSFSAGFRQIALMTLGKYLPGKVWGMAARAALIKQQGIGFKEALLATFHEQYLFLHAAVVLSCLLLAVLFEAAWSLAVGLLGLLSIPFALLSQNYIFILFNYSSRKLGYRDVLDKTNILSAKNYLKILAAYFLVWILSGIAFAGVYLAFFNSHFSLELLFALILANTVGNTLGFLALFAPGGIGVREGVASSILAGFMPLGDAVILSLLFRLWVVVFDALSSLVLLWPSDTTYKA